MCFPCPGLQAVSAIRSGSVQAQLDHGDRRFQRLVERRRTPSETHPKHPSTIRMGSRPPRPIGMRNSGACAPRLRPLYEWPESSRLTFFKVLKRGGAGAMLFVRGGVVARRANDARVGRVKAPRSVFEWSGGPDLVADWPRSRPKPDQRSVRKVSAKCPLGVRGVDTFGGRPAHSYAEFGGLRASTTLPLRVIVVEALDQKTPRKGGAGRGLVDKEGEAA